MVGNAWEGRCPEDMLAHQQHLLCLIFFFLLQDVMQYYLILELYLSEGTFIAYLNENKVNIRLSLMWIFRCCAPFFPGCNEELEMMGAV